MKVYLINQLIKKLYSSLQVVNSIKCILLKLYVSGDIVLKVVINGLFLSVIRFRSPLNYSILISLPKGLVSIEIPRLRRDQPACYKRIIGTTRLFCYRNKLKKTSCSFVRKFT